MQNGIRIETDYLESLFMEGEGAGGKATASSIISDLLEIAKGLNIDPLGYQTKQLKQFESMDYDERICSYYLRIVVKDIPGVLSSITKIFAKNKISIKNLLQNPDKKNNMATIIIITHKNLEKNYNNLFLNLVKNKFVLKKPTFIRIEKV